VKNITSRKNPICVHVRNLGKSKEYRTNHGEFLCDGIKLFEEAVKSKASITSAFMTSKLDLVIPKETELYMIDESIMDFISPLKNPQEIMFVCKIPETANVNLSSGTHILLDAVQDPGNVGTIIRSADAFGIESLLLAENCADPYNPKTIRASMGAIFRQKISYISLEELKESKARIIGTHCSDCKDIRLVDLKDAIIVLGNEGQGISENLRLLCDEMVKIPLCADSESLNVAIAASIIMWEAQRGH